MKPSFGRQSICPGPNIAWFDREYTLDEMVNHIYGRRESLVEKERPHMFAKELRMYVDYINELAILTDPDEPGWKKLVKMRKNLEKGMDLCTEIANGKAYPGENLASLKEAVNTERKRLSEIFDVEIA
jgi:hypothetical protein